MEENKHSYTYWRDQLINILNNENKDYKITSFQYDHHLRPIDIYRNSEIFEEFYNDGLTPYDAIFKFSRNFTDFIRPLGEFTDHEIEDEFYNRNIDINLDGISTYDLESALDGRWDAEYKCVRDMSTEELEDELYKRKINYHRYDDNFRANLAEILRLPNSFAYTNDEFIELVKEKLQKF